jgi:hypothetical protein
MRSLSKPVVCTDPLRRRPSPSRCGPPLNDKITAEATADYRDRLSDFAELDEAETMNDTGRAERIRLRVGNAIRSH